MNILRYISKDIEVTGKVIYHSHDGDIDLLSVSKKNLLKYRKYIQMIFQDPFSSLNPRMLVKDLIAEALHINYPDMSTDDVLEKVYITMEKVGLSREQANRYPHEFSGGQRQRIGIARSIITNPKIVIADEPVSALDVSIQAQVINLMQDLQEELDFTILFIAHDLSVVKHISQRVSVMYLGEIMEIAGKDELFLTPKHPYTKTLKLSTPTADPSFRHKEKFFLKGEIPSPLHKPEGCVFSQRCPIVKPECSINKPKLEQISVGHWLACPYYMETKNIQ